MSNNDAMLRRSLLLKIQHRKTAAWWWDSHVGAASDLLVCRECADEKIVRDGMALGYDALCALWVQESEAHAEPVPVGDLVPLGPFPCCDICGCDLGAQTEAGA